METKFTPPEAKLSANELEKRRKAAEAMREAEQLMAKEQAERKTAGDGKNEGFEADENEIDKALSALG